MGRVMERSTFAGMVACGVALCPSVVRAAPPPICTSAYEQGQLLRRQQKVAAAREQLRLCAQPSCPQLIVNDCSQWLEELQAAQPSVVPLATDEQGKNLVDVHLAIDDVPMNDTLHGQPIDVDPGTHRFTFSRVDREVVTTRALIAVGEKNKRLVVTLVPLTPLAAMPPPEPATTSSSALGTAGLVVGGLGIVGLALGTVFGVSAIVEQGDAHCPSNVCSAGSNPGALRTAVTDGNLSTVFFIAGGALTAAGLTMWLVAPSKHLKSGTSSAWLESAPIAGANGGGVVLRGGW